MIFNWFAAFKGDKKHLSQNLPAAVEREKTVLIPIKAEIALLFGNPSGSLRSLHDGAILLSKGETIFCQECHHSIYRDGHTADCQIRLKHAAALKTVSRDEL